MLIQPVLEINNRPCLKLMTAYASIKADFDPKIKGSFPLGELLITVKARNHLLAGEAFFAVQRHQMGDWGDLGKSAWARNQTAISRGRRIKSSYRSLKKRKFWVVTEADRSATTILLREDK